MIMALIPHVVDQRAQSDPNALYSEYPLSASSNEESYQKISYGSFANAVSGLA